MRDNLATILTRRYPALYGAGGDAYPFEVGDGWTGLLDALSETLVWHARIGERPPPRAAQVKEKFGQLRWYHGESEADRGAIDLAQEMSGRICEATGRQGRLGSRRGWWATRAPGLDGIEPRGVGKLDGDGRMGVPHLDLTADQIERWRSDVLADPIDVAPEMLAFPRGWLDLADGLLRLLSQARAFEARGLWLREQPSGVTTISLGRAQPTETGGAHSPGGEVEPARVERVGTWGGAHLRVDYAGGGEYARGAVALATALSRRLDRETGACSLA